MPKYDNKDIPSPSKSFAGKGIFPFHWAFTLLLPFRSLIFSAKELIRRLDISDDAKVLEVGPGPGFFSVPLARILTKGTLVLADIQPEMLSYARRRIDRARQKSAARGFAQVGYHTCDGHAFPFPDNSFDRIVLVTVLGEVDDRTGYLREFRRLLKPGGLLSITELAGDPDRLTVEAILGLADQTGFILNGRFSGRWSDTVNLHKGDSVVPPTANTTGIRK